MQLVVAVVSGSRRRLRCEAVWERRVAGGVVVKPIRVDSRQELCGQSGGYSRATRQWREEFCPEGC